MENLYWPTVLVLTVAFITTLYHLSVPVRTSWRYDIPGAVLTLAVWIGGSWLLRATLQSTVGGGGTSIYGPLAAPIVVLLWLYILSIAVLIGAAVNAACDTLFPQSSTTSARQELVRRISGVLPQRLAARRPATGEETPATASEPDADEGDAPRIDPRPPTPPQVAPPVVPPVGPPESPPVSRPARPAEASRNAERSMPD